MFIGYICIHPIKKQTDKQSIYIVEGNIYEMPYNMVGGLFS